MWHYVLSIGMLMLFCASFYKLLPSSYILSGMMLLFCLAFVQMFLENLEKKYYYDKKYLWNFSFGMFLFIVYSIGSILDFLGYVKFIVYFAFLWTIAPTFYLYGLRRLLYLKLVSGEKSKNILKSYEILKSSMNTLYFCDVIIILLYIFLILDKRI